MKSSIKILSALSFTAVTMTGCYTEPEVVREPAGAARTTVTKTVTVNQAPAKTVIVDEPAVRETVIVEQPKVEETIIVDQPPVAQVETVGVPPSGGHAWVPGHWTRAGDRWVWKSGQWEARPTPTAIYVPGHWENLANGYIWKEGYWK